MTSLTLDNYRNKLLQENQELRQILMKVYNELLSIFNEKKEDFVRQILILFNFSDPKKNK